MYVLGRTFFGGKSFEDAAEVDVLGFFWLVVSCPRQSFNLSDELLFAFTLGEPNLASRKAANSCPGSSPRAAFFGTTLLAVTLLGAA